ncbi:MAG: 1,6-anhydro-N-acetylmuramyl-L-alanine amidase AmpD [Pseudomonadota bacterium]
MPTQFSIENGWVSPAKHLCSPNFNDRPQQGGIDLLVIHNISLPPEQFGGGNIEKFFCNQLDSSAHPYFQQIKDLKVSSHLLIDREGSLVQFVSLNKRAWHAGQSYFNNRENCNDFSIGIELEGTDNIPYTENQYKSLIALTQTLLKVYPELHKDSIVGHSDIAPGRKTDPGPAFNWRQYLDQV